MRIENKGSFYWAILDLSLCFEELSLVPARIDFSFILNQFLNSTTIERRMVSSRLARLWEPGKNLPRPGWGSPSKSSHSTLPLGGLQNLSYFHPAAKCTKGTHFFVVAHGEFCIVRDNCKRCYIGLEAKAEQHVCGAA